jgi:hypothetical protein
MPTSTDGFGPEYLAARARLPTDEARQRLDEKYARMSDGQRAFLEEVFALRPSLRVLKLAIRCLQDPEWMARWRREQFKVIKGGK